MKYTRISDLLRSMLISSELLGVFSLFLIQLVLYGSGIFNGFVADDRTYFIDNDLYDKLSYTDFFKLFTLNTNYWGEHLPLRDYLNLLQLNEFSKNPLPYHLVSFFLFSFFVLLVYKIFIIIDQEDNDGKVVCFIATAFYISHPALVECVSYISGQKDLLCGIFTALTIIFSIKYFKEKTKYYILLAGSFYYLALFSKSVAIVNFLVIIIIYYFFEVNKKLYRDATAWLVFNLTAFWWIFHSMGGGVSGFVQKTDISYLLQLVNAVKIIGWQFYIMIKIYPRSFGYPFVENEIDIFFYFGLFVCIFFAIVLVFIKNKFIKTGIILYFIFLIPVLRFFYSASNAGVFDRYLFLPLFGISIIVYGILKEYKQKYVTVIVVVIILLNSVSTFLSTDNFKSDILNSENNYRNYPHWNRTSFDYAYALIEGGRLEDAELLIEMETALKSPSWVIPYFQGWIELERGELASAEESLRVAAMRASTGGYYPFPNIPLARTLLQRGKIDAADIFLQRVLILGGEANPLEYFKAKSLLRQRL